MISPFITNVICSNVQITTNRGVREVNRNNLLFLFFYFYFLYFFISILWTEDLSCAVNVKLIDIDQFLDSTEVLPILQVLEWGFQLGISQFCTNLGLSCLFVIIKVPIFSVGKMTYWVGNIWHLVGLIYWVGKVIYWVGIFNLLGKQMPTQLTCNLPLCLSTFNTGELSFSSLTSLHMLWVFDTIGCFRSIWSNNRRNKSSVHFFTFFICSWNHSNNFSSYTVLWPYLVRSHTSKINKALVGSDMDASHYVFIAEGQRLMGYVTGYELWLSQSVGTRNYGKPFGPKKPHSSLLNMLYLQCGNYNHFWEHVKHTTLYHGIQESFKKNIYKQNYRFTCVHTHSF